MGTPFISVSLLVGVFIWSGLCGMFLPVIEKQLAIADSFCIVALVGVTGSCSGF